MADLLVSASTGAMGSLLGKLGTMLSDEYKLLKGVRDDIKFLKAELEAMQVFLIVMAEEEKPDKQAKLRADAVREMSYEIEDNIDKFMILVEHEYCVLDLQNCVGLENHHVKDIERLFQLRYLNISWSRITELPGQIGDLKYLETLDASDTKLVELPKSVTRLKRLARLFVPDTIKYPDGIGDMENLQEFGNDISIFNQSLNFLEELGKLTNLRKLCINWVSFHESDEERYKEKRKSIVSSLCKLDKCKLRDLSIIFWLTEKDATFIAHPFFPALKSIRQINLYTGQLCWITKWMLSLVNLEILVIGQMVEKIEQQDVEMVGSIPTLLEFRVFSGCVISGGFQQLRSLEIGYRVRELMFEAGAMPNLKNLHLDINLAELKSGGILYWGIQHLSSFASLRVSLFD